GAQLRPRQEGSRGRLRPHLPGAPAHRAGGAVLRRSLRPMGRGRHAGYDGQRELILDHAAALFARGGYSATSMNQVAEACGLSKATLYHYYRDKYELLVSIADGHVTRLRAIVDEALAEEPAP